jgi:hypothetical protein
MRSSRRSRRRRRRSAESHVPARASVPFRDTVDLPLPGPVFIHEDGCPRYDAAAGFPPALRDAPLTFNAYGADRVLVARERTESVAEVDAAIERLLDDAFVDCVHVCSTRAGCFLCRLDRAVAT